jgi:hypothetical protein
MTEASDGGAIGRAGDELDGDNIDHAEMRRREHLAHELSGAIYGTILASTVVAALGYDPQKLEKSIVIVVVTSAVFYAAHVYSLTVAARIVAGQALTLRQVRGIALSEWPMMQSCVPILIPLVFGTLGWISRDLAADIALLVGIGALFTYGVLIGLREERGHFHVIANALIVGSFGVLILALKVLVH